MNRLLFGIHLTATLLWGQNQPSLPPKEWQITLNQAFSIAKLGTIGQAEFRSKLNPSTPPQRLISYSLIDAIAWGKNQERQKEIGNSKGRSRKETQIDRQEALNELFKNITINELLFSMEGDLLFKGTEQQVREKMGSPKGWVSRHSPAHPCQEWFTFNPEYPLVFSSDIHPRKHVPPKANYGVGRHHKNLSSCDDWELNEDAMQAFGWFINHPLHRPVQSLKFFKKSEQVFLTRIVFPDGSAHWLHLNFETNPRDPVEAQLLEDQVQLNGEEVLIYQKERYGLFLTLE